MRKLLLVVSYVGVLGIIAIIQLTLLLTPLFSTPTPTQYTSSKVTFAALPTHNYTISYEIIPADARSEIVRQIMKKYKSPLAEVAEEIVKEADKWKIDHRLIPALALKESGGCRLIPENSNNCWGYGIYKGKTTRFETYAQGVAVVTKALATRFKVDGKVTPETIMPLYTAGTDTTWASDILMYMDKME